MFQTKPTPRPLPNSPSYPVTELYLFNRHTRATFKALFGEEAPAYNLSFQIKRWADTSALINPDTGFLYEFPGDELISYKVWDESRKAIVTKVMTRAVAAAINLPGLIVYPKWENTGTTTAVMVSAFDGTAVPVNGALLVNPGLVSELVAQLKTDLNSAGHSGVVVSQAVNAAYVTGPFRLVYGSETRRSMTISIHFPAGNIVSYDASVLANDRYAAGFPVPGKWVMIEQAQPHFVPTVQSAGDMDLRPEIPIPVRDLSVSPKEVITCTPFGCTVFRSDKQNPDIPAPENKGTGLTIEQEQLLRSIKVDTALLVAAVVVK